MPFLDEPTGRVSLSDAFSLAGGMRKDELIALFAEQIGAKPNCDTKKSDLILPFPAQSVAGGQLAPVCQIECDVLRSVCLWAYPDKKGDGRAMLFRLLAASDPYPDTRGQVEIQFPFGHALISCDPRTDDATLLITYR